MTLSPDMDVPVCPRCKTDVFVHRYNGVEEWVCEACGACWDGEHWPGGL